LIKAVFFDWFYTLAFSRPNREVLYRRAFKKLGYPLDIKLVMRGIFTADRLIFRENLFSTLTHGNDAEQYKIAINYPKLILKEAGLETTDEINLKTIEFVRREYHQPTYHLFDDVLPVLRQIKERGLILGLVTNAVASMQATYRELGLDTYLDLVTNSKEAGAEKPKAPIFLLALKKAGVSAAETIMVGDQYELDILGAQGVGINPILIDRYELHSETDYTPRIRSLA